MVDLSEDDVLEILKLFEQSHFDFLHLEHGERKITVSKDADMPIGMETAPLPAQAAPAAPPHAPTAASAAIEEGLVPVTAPMVGKFYAAPSPTEPPFVQTGTQVAEGATLGLIEAMKVFTSIKTEIAGVIERIMVSNGQFVEYDQTLFLIRADQAGSQG